MNNMIDVQVETPEKVTDSIIKSIIGFDVWLEKNKREFIKNNQQKNETHN